MYIAYKLLLLTDIMYWQCVHSDTPASWLDQNKMGGTLQKGGIVEQHLWWNALITQLAKAMIVCVCVCVCVCARVCVCVCVCTCVRVWCTRL